MYDQVVDKNKLKMKSGKVPKLLKRLMDEIEILKSVRHPNIVQVYKVYENGNKVFIVMELMKGGELFDHIIERGLLSFATCCNLVLVSFCSLSLDTDMMDPMR